MLSVTNENMLMVLIRSASQRFFWWVLKIFSLFRMKIGFVGTHYAPNFEEVGGAYCFWDICACVRASVRPSVTLFDA